MKLLSIISILLLSIFFQNCASTVSHKKLKSHVEYLASDKLKGRFPGTEGGKESAEYIKSEFEKNGLTLLGDNGFQYFDVITGVNLGESNSFLLGSNSYKVGKDFTPLSFSKSMTHSGSIFVAGYGFSIKNDSLEWNDYSNANLDGKWVLIFRGAPDGDNPHGPFSEHSSLRTKVMTAKDNSASGVIFVSGEEFDKEDNLIPLIYEQSQVDIGIPVVHITRNLANKILRNQTVSEIEKTILNQQENFKPFNINNLVTAHIDMNYETVQTQNIVASIPGTDPKLKDEFIIIGAHYDHLGYGGDHSGSRRPDNHEIHNGADDNASGTSAVIELAHEMAKKGNNKRTLVFIAFGAEEMGLLGSKYFVKNSLVKNENIQLMMNMDMVGRLDAEKNQISIGGTQTAIDLEKSIEPLIKKSNLNHTFSPEGYGPSDHSSFYVNDIPVLFFFTGSHSDYHTPEDDADKVNYKGIASISDLILSITSYFDSEDRLVYQEAGPKEEKKRQRFKVTLGIMPDYTYSETKGLRVDAVLQGKPASNAGILDGDIITSIGNKPVGDIYEYMHRLGEINPGESAPVSVLRDGKELNYTVKF